MTKRIFVGVDLPPEMKDYLKSAQKPDIYWIKWMKPSNLHITLSFLGDLTEEKIEELKQVLREVAAEHSFFRLKFADFQQERDMLWLKPEDNAALQELQSDLQTRLKSARLGKRERRQYAPHVLIGKSKTRSRSMKWRPQNFSPIEFTADRISLYESRLTPGAATHILIQNFPLTPNPSPEGALGRGGREVEIT